MISFHEVCKNYAQQCALDDVSFIIGNGEMVFLTGHSGAGKTTLLKLIMLIEKSDQGQIYIDGKNTRTLTKKQIPLLRQSIGMVFQNPRLLMGRTVFDNIALPLVITGHSRDDIAKRVRAALDKVGLSGKEKKFPVELSYGEQQRVGIARAVVNKPKILLADEPTGNLDPTISKDIMDLFSAFNAVGTTVMIASHDLALIAGFNYRIVTLEHGKLIN